MIFIRIFLTKKIYVFKQKYFTLLRAHRVWTPTENEYYYQIESRYYIQNIKLAGQMFV